MVSSFLFRFLLFILLFYRSEVLACLIDADSHMDIVPCALDRSVRTVRGVQRCHSETSEGKPDSMIGPSTDRRSISTLFHIMPILALCFRSLC